MSFQSPSGRSWRCGDELRKKGVEGVMESVPAARPPQVGRPGVSQTASANNAVTTDVAQSQ